MALQVRNTFFDPSVPAQVTELGAMLGNATVIACVKKIPLEKSSQGKYLYEIACQGMMFHLEVSKDTDTGDITSLDNTIKALTGANAFVVHDPSSGDNWEIGHDDDLRVG